MLARRHLPQSLRVTGLGETGRGEGVRAAFTPGEFRLRLRGGVTYPGRTGKFTKLAPLGSAGRSTATTLLSMAAVQGRRRSDPSGTARKMLSFPDDC